MNTEIVIIACFMSTMIIWGPALIVLITPTNDKGKGSGTKEALEYLGEILPVDDGLNKFREGETNQDKRWEAEARKQAEPYRGKLDNE